MTRGVHWRLGFCGGYSQVGVGVWNIWILGCEGCGFDVCQTPRKLGLYSWTFLDQAVFLHEKEHRNTKLQAIFFASIRCWYIRRAGQSNLGEGRGGEGSNSVRFRFTPYGKLFYSSPVCRTPSLLLLFWWIWRAEHEA